MQEKNKFAGCFMNFSYRREDSVSGVIDAHLKKDHWHPKLIR